MCWEGCRGRKLTFCLWTCKSQIPGEGAHCTARRSKCSSFRRHGIALTKVPYRSTESQSKNKEPYNLSQPGELCVFPLRSSHMKGIVSTNCKGLRYALCYVAWESASSDCELWFYIWEVARTGLVKYSSRYRLGVALKQ